MVTIAAPLCYLLAVDIFQRTENRVLHYQFTRVRLTSWNAVHKEG